MRTKFVEHWKHKSGNSTKLKLYSEIKLSYTPEKYLNIIKSDKLKQATCSLRISNHIPYDRKWKIPSSQTSTRFTHLPNV